MSIRIIIWVEAHEKIALGHLMESLAFARNWRKNGHEVLFLHSPYLPASDELRRHNMPAVECDFDNAILTINQLAPKPSLVLINHRNVRFEHLTELLNFRHKVAVIDQLGNKKIACQLLINASVIDSWLKYDFPYGEPQCCFGTNYTILRDDFISARLRAVHHHRPRVLVTLGGVDRTGATLRVIEALAEVGTEVEKEIITGAGFPHKHKLEALKTKYSDSLFIFSEAVSDMPERMRKADVVISAGGNTLYEAAYLGVPTLVLWEDPHEREQGKAFETAGAALCLGNGISTPLSLIAQNIIQLLGDHEKRESMKYYAQKLVDGKGADRVAQELLNLISD